MTGGERPPELVGTWRVVRWEDRDSEDDEWVSSLPANVEGYAVYTEAGYWAVQLYAPPHDGGDAFHFGYFGFGVVHDVVREGGVLRGNLVVESHGSNAPDAMEYNDRPFEIEGDRFVVGDRKTWIRECVRVR